MAVPEKYGTPKYFQISRSTTMSPLLLASKQSSNAPPRKESWLSRRGDILIALGHADKLVGCILALAPT